MPRQTAAFPSCCCARRRRFRPTINFNSLAVDAPAHANAMALSRAGLAILRPGPNTWPRTAALTDQRSNRLPQFFLTPGGPCPYLPGRVERKVFARLSGSAGPAAERSADAFRLPPQPDDRLPAGLRRLQRLRLGAHRGGRLHGVARPEAHPQAQWRSVAPRGAGAGHTRAVRAAAHLSRFAPCRRRHVGHGPVRLCRHGRGDAGRHPYRRIPPHARRRHAGRLDGVRADRRARRRTVHGLQLLPSRRRPRAASARR